MSLRLRFLGTGASGGTPGSGRSRRLESSLLVDGDTSLLLDLTRHFDQQAHHVGKIDAVLLTHAHRDACGGVAQLRAWLRERSQAPVTAYASAETILELERRYMKLDHCRFVTVADGERCRVGRLTIMPLAVPHAREERYRTFAWKLTAGTTTIVYASDLARLTTELRRFCRDANLLVVDAALWRRRLFSHLRIDEALPELCRWPVQRILLTQIGRTAPPHAELRRKAATLCSRAQPAYDGMTIELP